MGDARHDPGSDDDHAAHGPARAGLDDGGHLDPQGVAVALARLPVLVRRLDPYVKAAATGRTELADAVRTALSTHLPQLSPHAGEVVEFLARYYGVD